MSPAHSRPARPRVAGIGRCVAFGALLAAARPTGATAQPQTVRPVAATPAATQGTAPAVSAHAAGDGPDLQGLWDFTMRVGDRTSPGFVALGPVDGRWAGSITMYLTNTLAIRSFSVQGDSIRMIVASREGDVRFVARLTDDGRTMQGIVEYHGGARLPMTAIRRPQPVVPR